MNDIRFCISGSSPALTVAAKRLQERGLSVSDTPFRDATHLLLPVPSFDAGGSIKGGGDLGQLLAKLPADITVLGGNLSHPALANYPCIDLLADETYLCKNAAITADCALPILMEALPVTLPGCPILIIGWGRIGQCLAQKLKALDADVAIAARREESRAMAGAFGFSVMDTDMPCFALRRYRAIINTVPISLLCQHQVDCCRVGCVKLDLASVKGIYGEDVIWARGLPGKDAPETSGELIAKTVIRLISQKEVLE